MLPFEQAAAKERQGAEKPEKQRAVDKIGAFAGLSGRTVEKITRIVDRTQQPLHRYRMTSQPRPPQRLSPRSP
jgi:hypothetical protein